MIAPPTPSNEGLRMKALRELHILYTDQEERFDRITRLGARVLNAPIVMISLVDTDRQWFKSCIGVDTRETPRSVSFCGHAILQDDLFIIENALEDERFHDNPLVTGDMHIRAYAGRPLKFNGQNIGTFCIMDTKPRKFTEQEKSDLNDIGHWVERELEAYDREKKMMGVKGAK